MPLRKSSKKSSRKSSKKGSKKSSYSRKSSRKSSKKSYGNGGSHSSSKDNQKIIKEHIESLNEQMKEKKLYSFCVFPEQGFKKKMRGTTEEIAAMVKKNAGKYKHLACINISPWHNRRDSIGGKAGIWLSVTIIVSPINPYGVTVTKKGFGINMHWKEEDFKITKMSLKLLEALMTHTVDKKLSIAGTFGVPFHELIKELKIEKINISEYLTPLSGLE